MVNAEKRTMWRHALENLLLWKHEATSDSNSCLQIRDVILDSIN